MEEEQTGRIPKMDAILFALSLEMVLLQMRILEGSSELRLADWQPTSKIEQLQYEKLTTDRQMVNTIIRRTLIEVAESGAWSEVKKGVEQLRQKDCDVTSLRLTNKQLRASRDAIINELDEKRDQWVTELKDADEKVAILRDKTSDDLQNANARLCYAEKWLFARFEALELRLNVPRPPPPRSDHEQRVHEELLKAFELQIQEREKALEYWRQRYDVDLAEISKRVHKKCEEMKTATAKRIELQNLYDLHAGEIRGWLTFKRERAARLAREQQLRASATHIQAWWRGIMVRKALGQFRYLRQTKGKGKKK